MVHLLLLTPSLLRMGPQTTPLTIVLMAMVVPLGVVDAIPVLVCKVMTRGGLEVARGLLAARSPPRRRRHGRAACCLTSRRSLSFNGMRMLPSSILVMMTARCVLLLRPLEILR